MSHPLVIKWMVFCWVLRGERLSSWDETTKHSGMACKMMDFKIFRRQFESQIVLCGGQNLRIIGFSTPIRAYIVSEVAAEN